MSAHDNDTAVRFNASRPCPVCGTGTKSCSQTRDGLVRCRAAGPADAALWVCLSAGPEWKCYRRRDGGRPPAAGAGTLPRAKAGPDWARAAARFAANLTPEHRAGLAAALRLPAAALDVVAELGFTAEGVKDRGLWVPAWTFPLRTPGGCVTGIAKRFPRPVSINGGKPVTKALAKGGTNGLFLARGWWERPGPVLLVEGASNTLAAAAAGLAAIGRFNNLVGPVGYLAEMVRDLPPARPVVVVGDNDARPDPKRPGQTLWPGKDGADRTAAELSTLLGRPVLVGFPPDGVKDLRDWVVDLAAGQGEVEDWAAVGAAVRSHFGATARPGDPPPPPPAAEPAGEILVESLAGLQPKPVRFLVPGKVPAGMLGMIAGEGGHGKSMTTLELAAAVTVGRCAFGLAYPDPPKGKALLISCEDDWERTILPRLAALGADLTQVLRIRGVKLKADGATLDFHLGHFRELDRLLAANPEIRLVTIDPAGAYIGRAGVNENKDADLRAILGPLSEAANRSGCCIIMIKHLNKSAGVSAVQRVSGSVGYINAVRFAYMIAPDPDNPDRRLMLPIKANVLPSRGAGMAYHLDPLPPDAARGRLLALWPDLPPADLDALSGQMFVQRWEDGVTVDANDVSEHRQAKGGARADDLRKCEEAIRTFLGQRAWPEKELEAEILTKQGFTFSVYRSTKAKMRTGDKSDPTRLSGKPVDKGGGWWVWIGPQGHRPADRGQPDEEFIPI